MKEMFNQRLTYKPPLDWDSLIRFLEPRAIPGVEAVNKDSYRRTIDLNGKSGIITVRPAKGRKFLNLNILFAHTGSPADIIRRVRNIFDLDADPAVISEHLAKSAFLKPVVLAFPGIRVPGAWDAFELAVRAILGQQISVQGATTLAGRLVRQFGTPLPAALIERAKLLTHLFPRPETLATSNVEDIGMPNSRAMTIKTLAGAVANGEINFEPCQDINAFVMQLTRIKGIGDWTAQYVAMRALKAPDAFPASDLGLLKGAADGDAKLTSKQLRKIAESWRPWRAYAAMYLWQRIS